MIARPIALLFAGMDVDHDHVIDEAELANGIMREWQAIGTRTVSALSLAEWSVYALGDADALPNHIAFDRNFDGQVTDAELLIKAPERSQSRTTSESGQRPSGDDGRPPR